MGEFLATVQPGSGWSLPPAISEEAARVDSLLLQNTWLVGAIFVVLCTVMVVSLVRRRSRTDSAEPSRRAVLSTLGVALGIFGVVDGNLLVRGLNDVNGIFWNFDRVDAMPDVVRIQVNAHQWAWDLRYEGTDGKFGTPDDVVVLNQLFVPVGKPVLLQIASTDVVHSFSVPSLRVKTDAVPGSIHSLWFRPEQLGDYEIACAQFCGPQHYKMRGVLHVVSAEEFQRWLALASADAARGDDPEDASAHWAWPWRRP